ncbi:unnamed protein product [Nezara viridula]|uniref:Uncharacterized protein n=1 Tax=Nezara viridula TaxID=85310 RepID=A0A9P0HLN9_NEZVI|nr:unnamed protein product [Nezara viridula]
MIMQVLPAPLLKPATMTRLNDYGVPCRWAHQSRITRTPSGTPGRNPRTAADGSEFEEENKMEWSSEIISINHEMIILISGVTINMIKKSSLLRLLHIEKNLDRSAWPSTSGIN